MRSFNKERQMLRILPLLILLLVSFSATGSYYCSVYLHPNDQTPTHQLQRDNSNSLTFSQAGSAHGMPRGTPLYEKNEDDKINTPIASMLMTIVIATEETSHDEYVFITEEAKILDLNAKQSVELEKYNYRSVSYLICAILYQDSAASALALRQHLSDNNEDFVKIMNAKARTLGMSETYFHDIPSDKKSPSPLFSDADYTTTKDLNALFRFALSDPDFKTIFNSYRRVFISIEDTPEIISNQTISIQASVLHLNGFSSFASENDDTVCILATSVYKDFEVAYVLLKTQPQSVVREMDTIIDNIYNDFSHSPFVNESESFGSVKLDDYPIEVNASFASTIKYIHPNNTSIEVQDYYFVPYNDYSFPIQKGTPLGIVYFTLDNDIVIPVEIVSSDYYADAHSVNTSIITLFEHNYDVFILSALIFLIIIFIIIVKSARLIQKHLSNR